MYEAVAQEVAFGCILTSKTELKKIFDRLQIVHSWGKSQLQQSYEDCNASLVLDDQDIASCGPLQERGKKDRPTSEIPDLQYRTTLDEVPYINAVNIDSYFRQDAIVATQMPSPDTIADFCQLVIKKQCSTIVMLNAFDKKDKSMSLYWSRRGVYGKIKVTKKKLKKFPTYNLIDLFFEEQKKKDEGPPIRHGVRMIQYTAWDFRKSVVPEVDPFLDLLALVRRQLTQTLNTTLLVHCLNGSEQTALFCVMYNLIEKADTNKYINIVSTVRKVKTRRPTGLKPIEQYRFCYEAFIAYLCKNDMIFPEMFPGNVTGSSESDESGEDSGIDQIDIDFQGSWVNAGITEKIYDTL